MPSFGLSKAASMPKALGPPPPPRSWPSCAPARPSASAAQQLRAAGAAFPDSDSLSPAEPEAGTGVDAVAIGSSTAISTSSDITLTPCSACSVFDGMSMGICAPAGTSAVDGDAVPRPAALDRFEADGDAAAPPTPSRGRSRRSRKDSPPFWSRKPLCP